MKIDKGETLSQRIAMLAESLKRLGVSEGMALVYAHGILSVLARDCSRRMTDVIGNEDELEAIIQWTGPRYALGTALRKAGLIAVSSDRKTYWFPSLVTMMTPGEKERWRRKNGVTYATASSRARQIPTGIENADAILPPPEVVMQEGIRVDDMNTNLFGEPDEPEESRAIGGKERTGSKFHRDLVAYWDEQYHRKYGLKYPFNTADFKHLSGIMSACASFDVAKRCVDAYLADRSPFFVGHKISKLLGDLPRFLVKSNGDGRSDAAIRTQQRDASLAIRTDTADW